MLAERAKNDLPSCRAMLARFLKPSRYHLLRRPRFLVDFVRDDTLRGTREIADKGRQWLRERAGAVG